MENDIKRISYRYNQELYYNCNFLEKDIPKIGTVMPIKIKNDMKLVYLQHKHTDNRVTVLDFVDYDFETNHNSIEVSDFISAYTIDFLIKYIDMRFKMLKEND